MRWARQSTIAEASSRNEHLYNGKEVVDELGLGCCHYGARYYDTELARWVEMDPADQFHSPYSYVGGDPVNLVDPDGRMADDPLSWLEDGYQQSPMEFAQNNLTAPSSRTSFAYTFFTTGLTSQGLGSLYETERFINGSATRWGKVLTSSRTVPMTARGYQWIDDGSRGGYQMFANNLKGVSTAGKALKYGGQTLGGIGLAYDFARAYNDPSLLKQPGYIWAVGTGAMSFVNPVWGVGTVAYYGADWYCSGAKGGACGGFNYVTETPVDELYKDAANNIK